MEWGSYDPPASPAGDHLDAIEVALLVDPAVGELRLLGVVERLFLGRELVARRTEEPSAGTLVPSREARGGVRGMFLDLAMPRHRGEGLRVANRVAGDVARGGQHVRKVRNRRELGGGGLGGSRAAAGDDRNDGEGEDEADLVKGAVVHWMTPVLDVAGFPF